MTETTQLEDTNDWIEENSSWLGPDHRPMIGQLRMLARTMDSEMREKSRVSASAASAYRMAYSTLMEFKPLSQRQREALEDDGDTLMSPAEWAGDMLGE